MSPTNEDMTPSDEFLRTARSLGMTEEQINEGLVDLTARRAQDAERTPLPAAEYRTQQHPTIKRLERQAQQFHQAAATATTQAAQNMLIMQASFITVLAKLGQRPDQWDEIAEQMIPVNIDMLATVVAAGVAQMPRGVVVEDSEVVDG